MIIKKNLKIVNESLILDLFKKFIPERFKSYIELMIEIVRKKAK
jgi:hypothetical protein